MATTTPTAHGTGNAVASFYDVLTGRNTEEFELGPGQVAYIGLRGGDPVGNLLNVTTFVDDERAATWTDNAVTRYEQKGLFDFIYEIDGNMLSSRYVRACIRPPGDPNGLKKGDFAKPAHAKLGTAFSSRERVRQDIVGLARSFVGRSHYLWGSAGGRPGHSDGNGSKAVATQLRKAGLDPNNKAEREVVAVNTAFCDAPNHSTCAGRSSRDGVAASPGMTLEDYLALRRADVAAKRTDQTKWDGAGPKNLYPRFFYFDGKPQKLVWGESCIGVHHFDCIGLVNYCYGKAVKGGFQREIPQFRHPEKISFVEVLTDDKLDADIVIPVPSKQHPDGFGHIGMIYRLHNVWRVVQATETEQGLSDGAVYNPLEWRRFRMNARAFDGF